MRTPKLLLLVVVDLILKVRRLLDGRLILVSLGVHRVSLKHRLFLRLIMNFFTHSDYMILLHFYLFFIRNLCR